MAERLGDIPLGRFRLRSVRREGEGIVWKLRCPGCGLWADIDDDQRHGRISVDCPECPFHETHNFYGALEAVTDGLVTTIDRDPYEGEGWPPEDTPTQEEER